jgi:hypothetical protein
LAAWLCAGFSGCAYGIGRCCVGARRNDRSGGDGKGNNGYNSYATPGGYGNNGPDDMRLHAIRDEQIRKQNQKEQGLPSFSELERQPLTAGGVDKDEYVTYQDDRVGAMPGGMPGQGQPRNGLARDGSVLNGVGVGYGRRTPRNDQSVAGPTLGYGGGYAQSLVSSAGAAGVGAGGGGVDQPTNNCMSTLTGRDALLTELQTTTTLTPKLDQTNKHTIQTRTVVHRTIHLGPTAIPKQITALKGHRRVTTQDSQTPINPWNHTMELRYSLIRQHAWTRTMRMGDTSMTGIRV